MPSFLVDESEFDPRTRTLTGSQQGLVTDFGSMNGGNNSAVRMSGTSTLTLFGSAQNIAAAATVQSDASTNVTVNIASRGSIFNSSGPALDVTFDLGFTLNNFGSISGGDLNSPDTTIRLVGTTAQSVATIVNDGTIAAATGVGSEFPKITLISGRLDLTNSGDISVNIRTAGGRDTIVNSGTIGGASLGGGQDRFENTGTVNGSLFMGDSADTVINRVTISEDCNLGTGNDVFDGLGGAVRDVIGGAGNDYIASSYLEIAYGGSGKDEIHVIEDGVFSSGFASLYGGAGNDILRGNANSTSYGDSGDDDLRSDFEGTLFGGTGNDSLGTRGIMTGGAGKDTFVFLAGGIDVFLGATIIEDYVDADDKIDLSAFNLSSKAAALDFATIAGQTITIHLPAFDAVLNDFVDNILQIKFTGTLTIADLEDNLIV